MRLITGEGVLSSAAAALNKPPAAAHHFGLTPYGTALASFVRSVMPPYNHLTQRFTCSSRKGEPKDSPCSCCYFLKKGDKVFATATAEIKRGVSTKGKYTIIGGLASVLVSDICTQESREFAFKFLWGHGVIALKFYNGNTGDKDILALDGFKITVTIRKSTETLYYWRLLEIPFHKIFQKEIF
jgi:hypothetical protein